MAEASSSSASKAALVAATATPTSKGSTEAKKQVIVVLEHCPLETGKIGKEFVLLNCDDHKNFLKKHGKDPADYRPDIAHQCLLTLLDSPLNKAGHLRIYLHTRNNTLIEVSPHIRIPRTYKRFAGLMVQLLHDMVIRAGNGSEKLMHVIKNPVTDHIPVGCPKLKCSYNCEKLVDLKQFLPTFASHNAICFIVGGFSHGSIEIDYNTDTIAFSEYPLSASVACGRLCTTFEQMWGIL